MTFDHPILLLPGMGADARMFEPLRAALPQLQCPAWIEPRRRESIRDYAQRLAEVVEPAPGTIIGGASFGGMVALELAVHVGAPVCVLLGSVTSREQLPPWLRHARVLAAGLRFFPWGVATFLARIVAGTFRTPDAGLLRQFGAADPAFLRWACGALLHWEVSPEVERLQLIHLHGSDDWILPARYAAPTRVIAGAGHILSVTHPEAVIEHLDHAWAELEQTRS